MILVALGANLPSASHGGPLATLTAALAAFREQGIDISGRSRWYESAPVPISDQPWYVNAVVSVTTRLGPGPLLERLHAIEATFGRVRGVANAPRLIDLDLLAYDDRIEAGWPILPHPRLYERAFVLLPLRDVAPDWRHPGRDESIDQMLARIGSDQITRPLGADAGQL
jgi:2-amino-4-hydroxy-6-hydroxymethyldihydropteridine diphosphokinase